MPHFGASSVEPQLSPPAAATKLEKQALRDFREVTHSEWVTSKTPTLSKYARYINIYTMAGVLRMAWISEGEMGRAVRNATMKLIHSIPAGGGGLKSGEFVKLFSWNNLTNFSSQLTTRDRSPSC